MGDPKTLAAASVSLERRDGTLTTSVKRLVSASLSSWARNGMGLELANVVWCDDLLAFVIDREPRLGQQAAVNLERLSRNEAGIV